MKQNGVLSRKIMALSAVFISTFALAATRVHVVTFGRWIPVQWFVASSSDPLVLKVRPLLVDGRAKEYVAGPAHEITDRLFVVRRVFRINDSMPEDVAPRWLWQRGGWLQVDRVTGRVSPTMLPAFDPYLSAASWYRDYAAYCGVGDDGKKTYAVVVQLSRRKPVLKKLLSITVKDDAGPDSLCPPPQWHRRPVRITFAPDGAEKQTFSIRGTAVDLLTDEEDED